MEGQAAVAAPPDDAPPSSPAELKAMGNDLFKQQLYAPAAACYSDALRALGAEADEGGAALRATCLLNRAACRLKTGEPRGAVEDCGAVLADDADNVKALFRRGQAHAELQQLELAKADLLRAAKLAPKDAAIRQHYEAVKASLKSERGSFSQGFERMLEQGGQEVEEDQLEHKGLGWQRLERKVYEYPVAASRPEHKPKATDFALGPCLGEGNFCRVHLGTDKETGEEFAVKVMEKAKVEKLKKREHKNIMNEIFMERDVMKRMDHPNIGRLFYTFQDQFNLYFATELLPCGELWHKLMDDEYEGCQVGVPLSQARFYAAEALNALAYLRASGIAHRDLKPENLMLTSTGHLKLIDFGTAKNLVDTKLNGPEFVGTAEYMAPEVFHNRGQTVDSRADLWSLGVVVYQLLSGETPFKTGSPYLTFKKARSTAPLQHCPAWWPVEVRDLVSRLLVKDQGRRLGAESFDELRAHPFFAGVDFGSLPASVPPARTREELALEAAAAWVVRQSSQVDAEEEGGAAEAGPEGSTDARLMEGVDASQLFHYLDRRKLFANPSVYRAAAMHGAGVSASEVPFGRARWRGFSGLSSASEFEFTQTFHFLVVTGCLMEGDGTGPEAGERLRRIVAEINSQSPRCRFLAMVGNPVPQGFDEDGRAAAVEACKVVLRTLDPAIPLLCVGCGPEFGDNHFSFWFGGCCGLVLNDGMVSAAGAGGPEAAERREEERRWMHEELACMMPSGARHLLVFHAVGGEATAPVVVDAMRLAGVRATFSCGEAASEELSVVEVPRERARAAPPVAVAPAAAARTNTADHSSSASSQSEEEEEGRAASTSDDSEDDPEDVSVPNARLHAPIARGPDPSGAAVDRVCKWRAVACSTAATTRCSECSRHVGALRWSRCWTAAWPSSLTRLTACRVSSNCRQASSNEIGAIHFFCSWF